MKPYFGKQVIEAPRSGSSARGPKVREYGRLIKTEDGPDYEGLSGRVPMLLRHYDRKNFSDKLGVIRNYLISSCGRLWDDVWSELCRELRKGGRGVQHILEAHIDVGTNTWRGQSGNVWDDNKYGPIEVGGNGYRSYRVQFYVEPETGILRQSQVYRRPDPPKGDPDYRDIAPGKRYQRYDGIWFYREYFVDEFGGWNTTLKRQLGKKQLRDLKLKNSH